MFPTSNGIGGPKGRDGLLLGVKWLFSCHPGEDPITGDVLPHVFIIVPSYGSPVGRGAVQSV